ncbi:ATP synthase subunit a [Ephemeroptericola cinctiostellae]|uniref:ATP synthase subunit a n=1 Tax=Ephemeroptericola cinctiostellae TaxID=2268024 RepID=A0A345D8S3_9BURK|nr:F0F1 ATP synthase subunit A [Ephemeroptericola cinctiostellae]AXF84761.1 ATP synthase subunit a [Ephemeroptericola cinctiostellae]
MSTEAGHHVPANSSEYIGHHLINLTNSGEKQTKLVDFSVINVDTVFFSVFLGLLGLFLLWLVARKVTSGVPSRTQAAVEALIEIVDDQAKAIVHGDRTFIAPLALTVFFWVVLMNAMDWVPIDLAGWLNNMFGWHLSYTRVVATADINATMGMALGVFLLMMYYSLKIKGLGGFAHELISAPFGNHWALIVPNLFINIVEYFSKTLSLGIRLFGNMFAGELIFALIATMGAAWGTVSMGTGIGLALGHLIAGSIWAIFHILVVLLQAFIFMMLTLVYVGQAHESH